MIDRPMPEEHEAILRTAFGLQADEAIPDKVLRCYWRVKLTADRLYVNMSSWDLMWIAVLSGEKLPHAPVDTVYEMAERGELKHGDRVLVQWRGGHWYSAAFHGLAGRDECLAQIDGDESAEDRRFTPDKVRMPDPEEILQE